MTSTGIQAAYIWWNDTWCSDNDHENAGYTQIDVKDTVFTVEMAF